MKCPRLLVWQVVLAVLPAGLPALVAEAGAPAVPTNLVVEGIPPIPDALKSNVAPYLALGGASFRGWHPQRREILVTARRGGLTQLSTVTEPNGKRTALTRWSEPVSHGWFQPQSGDYFIFQSDSGGNEQYQFYLLDMRTKTRTPLLLTDGRSRNSSPRWSRNGRWFAYASTRRNGRDNDIYVVDPAHPASTRCVATNTSPSWFLSDWSSDDTYLLLRRGISDSQTELWLLDWQRGERRLLTKKGERVYYAQPRFGDGDSAVYVLSDDRSDFLTLTRLDLKTGRRELLASHVSWDVEDFEISPDGRIVAFVVNEDGFSRLRLLELATRRELTAPRIPSGIISNLAWHEKLLELGFTLESAESPGDAYSWNFQTAELIPWTGRVRSSTQLQQFARPELVKLNSFDGLTISSIVYRPDARKFPGRRPVLIIIHGGPAAQSRPGFRGSANFYINELGIALIYPNVRGSSGYGRRFQALDDGMKREDAVRDIGAILEWIKSDGGFDPGRIAVMGTSYGGFMALACLVKYNDVFRCGVSNVGIANFVTFLRDTADYRRGGRRQEYGDERQPAMRAFLERISPSNNADKIRAPLLIVHGKNDPRVPVTEAERMRDAIRANGGTVWYLMASDEGHGFQKKSNLDFQFYATVMFLQQYLLGN
ncbi:MAG: prolyl oligopeptidase family serine peptidase [Verrucomicrobiae bacterium]|nr:prolyl oligopeptidase family serine peptidase [Verrucomicrobiae bacterium]